MTTELQNKVWSILPKEFKKEVKRLYDNSPALGAKAVLLLENLFGIPNLTSDTEGENGDNGEWYADSDLEPYKLQKLEIASRILAGMCTKGVSHTTEGKESMVNTVVIMSNMLMKRILKS